MFGTSYRIAKIWGIPIKLDMSLIILFFILALNYGFHDGMLVAVGLLISIVLHELGHSVVAIQKGCRVREITLMFIGGAAQMERIPTRPLDEFLMAIAGPAVSLVLGLAGIFWGGNAPLPQTFPMQSNILQWLGIINITLVVFNLLPSFPMDGGRIFRAALTPKFGRLKATFIAARLGQAMAIFFGVYGFLPPTGWMLVVIAFFIFVAAGNEYKMVQIQEAAKRRGFDDWIPPEDAAPDQVIISPPPYEKKGRPTRTDIDREDPFRNSFGKP